VKMLTPYQVYVAHPNTLNDCITLLFGLKRGLCPFFSRR